MISHTTNRRKSGRFFHPAPRLGSLVLRDAPRFALHRHGNRGSRGCVVVYMERYGDQQMLLLYTGFFFQMLLFSIALLDSRLGVLHRAVPKAHINNPQKQQHQITNNHTAMCHGTHSPHTPHAATTCQVRGAPHRVACRFRFSVRSIQSPWSQGRPPPRRSRHHTPHSPPPRFIRQRCNDFEQNTNRLVDCVL